MENNKNVPKVLKEKYIPTSEFYSQIIDSLQDYAIFTFDNNFKINSWSSGASKIFGYETNEVIGEHFDIIFTPEDLKSNVPQKEIESSLSQGRASDNRWHIAKDKSLFYAFGLVFPLIGLNGEQMGFVKILRDLTSNKQAEDSINKYIEELEELNAHKESVLAVLSHDLRSPLSSIIGITSYLKENFSTMKSDVVYEMLEMLHKSATDELAMLDYLVEWARIKFASEMFSPANLNVMVYVNKVFATLAERASKKSITLFNNIDCNTFVFADSKMLISILQNLISNAINHTLTGGKITISANKFDNEIVIQVNDTGHGMSETTLKTLFTPQMHVLSESRRKNRGAGIGLLIVKGFLEKNGGNIWAESIEGKGSSFYFTLPTKHVIHTNGHSSKFEFHKRA